MPLIEFVGQSVQDSGNIAANTGRLINCYRELVVGQGKTSHVLQSVLGQELLSDLGAAPVRAMGESDARNWVVGDGKLFELASDGTQTQRGVISDDAVTHIDGNFSDVTVTSGRNYYVWDGVTISQPTTKTFTEVLSHFHIDGYTVLLEADGKRFQWSSLGDASTLDALHFASAKKANDNLVRGFEVQGNAVFLCKTSTELWQPTGQSGTEAFSFVTSWNRGLRSANLITKFDDSLFFVGDDDNVYLGFGPQAVDITTPAINTALTRNDPTHCFYYEDRGHKFCVLRFSDRPAWVFDVKMREWHERAEGAGNGPWRAVAALKGDTWQVGNDVGEVHSLSRINRDLNAPLRRTAISNPLYTGQKFRVPMIEINTRVGEEMLNSEESFGLTLGNGDSLRVEGGFSLRIDSTDGTERAAEIELSVSKNGGKTWGDPKPRPMGYFGDHDQRMIWRGLGQAQQMALRLYVDDPGDYQINTTAIVEVA